MVTFFRYEGFITPNMELFKELVNNLGTYRNVLGILSTETWPPIEQETRFLLKTISHPIHWRFVQKMWYERDIPNITWIQEQIKKHRIDYLF